MFSTLNDRFSLAMCVLSYSPIIILSGIHTVIINEDLMNFYERNHNLLDVKNSTIEGL
jgi:hypothetical protein